jgi:hypothetical protein
MTEKRQTSQGYIIRILQHFATKLRNITNFVMLFPTSSPGPWGRGCALSSCDEIFVQAYLDQNFTHKGKGLLVGNTVLYASFLKRTNYCPNALTFSPRPSS